MSFLLKVLILGMLLLYSNNLNSKNWMILGGAYYDNIKNFNVNIGVACCQSTVKKKKEIEGEIYTQTSHTNFLYTDVSKSKKSQSFGLGWGRQVYAANYRIGISHIGTEVDKLLGVEGTVSILFYSVKAGIYNSKNEQTKFMIGLGIGW